MIIAFWERLETWLHPQYPHLLYFLFWLRYHVHRILALPKHQRLHSENSAVELLPQYPKTTWFCIIFPLSQYSYSRFKHARKWVCIVTSTFTCITHLLQSPPLPVDIYLTYLSHWVFLHISPPRTQTLPYPYTQSYYPYHQGALFTLKAFLFTTSRTLKHARRIFPRKQCHSNPFFNLPRSFTLPYYSDQKILFSLNFSPPPLWHLVIYHNNTIPIVPLDMPPYHTESFYQTWLQMN